MLSYRIHALDHVITNQDDDEVVDHPRHLRIQALIEHQLEQHAETLWQISQHLKQSALFYDSELAYEYRMHPHGLILRVNMIAMNQRNNLMCSRLLN